MSAKAEIMAVIAKTDDPNMKTMMILMLAVLEEISAACVDNGEKIDAMRADEAGLRLAVLNGHSAVHDSHHEWVGKRILDEAEAVKDEKASKRKIRDGIAEWLIRLALVALAGAAWLK